MRRLTKSISKNFIFHFVLLVLYTNFAEINIICFIYMQKTAKDLLTVITEAVQEKKGTSIVIVDLSNIENVICKYFIICQGNSTTQVNAIAEEVTNYTREHSNEKPLAISGQDNGVWVAMDYSDIILHIFQPEARVFYDLEHLWEDAKLTKIPDIK